MVVFSCFSRFTLTHSSLDDCKKSHFEGRKRVQITLPFDTLLRDLFISHDPDDAKPNGPTIEDIFLMEVSSKNRNLSCQNSK